MSFEFEKITGAGAVGDWSRRLGVSLRPWSGEAPLSLILRGAIHVVISAFFLSLILRIPGEVGIGGSSEELRFLGGLMTLVSVALVVLIVIGLARVSVGIVDTMRRQTVTGTVLSLRDRKALDLLPRLAQRAVFERRANGMDNRRVRTELVLETEDGARQWTVRSTRIRGELEPGARVRLTVTTLAGHIAAVERLA